MLPRNLHALRDRKNNWSLADDHELRNVLEEIRSSLNSKMNDVSEEIEVNALKIANAYVQVSNLNNQLSLFAADQFIESRVGDDTSACADTTLTSQAVIQSEGMETTDNLRQAVSMGLELMQTQFKRIDIRPEDLDEDDDSVCMPEPIFEPYDENLSRPLPFLIGSSDWNSSSCAVSLEECAESAKVTGEVVISLPPFTQPKVAECRDPSYSDALDGKLSHIMSNQATWDTNDVEAEIGSCSNEYSIKAYTSQDMASTSSSQISLLKEKEVENAANFTFDLSKNGTSKRYSEVCATPRSPEVSVKHSNFKMPHRPPDPEVCRKLQESGIPVKKISTPNTMEDQVKRKISESIKSSKAPNKLFVDSSSDEDDLFSNRKNTDAVVKRHISTYSNDSQIISIAEPQRLDPQKNADVHDPDLFADVSKLKNLLKTTDHIFVNDTKTSDKFRNKLDDILSNKVMSNITSSVEKCQGKEIEEKTKDDGTNAVLPSLAKFRAKRPPRRSPSLLLQNSDKRMEDKDEATSIHASIVISESTENNRTLREKANVHERQDGHRKIDSDSVRYTEENVNRVKQKKNTSSIFSSDSDDDIFSTLSGKSKTKALVSRLHIGNDNVLSLPPSRDDSFNSSGGRAKTAKTDLKLKNLFDSDDDDIFANTILVKKEEQQSSKDKQAVLEGVIQEAIISKNDGSFMEKKEAVVPTRLSTSKLETVDIFGDDSDDDLFS